VLVICDDQEAKRRLDQAVLEFARCQMALAGRSSS
jgi:hypothetical protein